MPPAVLERPLRLFSGVGFVNASGLTETSSTIAVLWQEDHRQARRGSCGYAGRRCPASSSSPAVEPAPRP
jgi:acyl-CoA synthetase (AMP-forming)/AMP-acid ligase II